SNCLERDPESDRKKLQLHSYGRLQPKAHSGTPLAHSEHGPALCPSALRRRLLLSAWLPAEVLEQARSEHVGLAASETEAQPRLQNNLDSSTVGLSVEHSSRRFSILFLNREQAWECRASRGPVCPACSPSCVHGSCSGHVPSGGSATSAEHATREASIGIGIVQGRGPYPQPGHSATQEARSMGSSPCPLPGGFSRFQAECPHLCETSLDSRGGPSTAPVPSPVVGLGGLCLGSDCSDAESEPDRDSMSCGLDSDGATPPPAGLLPSFPVQILPNLYLGSARDSANVESLAKLGIRYILNLGGPPGRPPPAPHAGPLCPYLDEALSQNCGVLVHCLAGVSRSVTVTVAYLMQKLHLSLNDAYDLVKRK
ncbi:hypothetical protein E2I00_016540, partial [Balaenoptera physalus]